MVVSKPTKEQKERYEKLIKLGCFVGENYADKIKENPCGGKLEIHHNRRHGGKKDHDETICLCTYHHSAQTPNAFGYAVHKGLESFEFNFTEVENMIKRSNNQIKNMKYD